MDGGFDLNAKADSDKEEEVEETIVMGASLSWTSEEEEEDDDDSTSQAVDGPRAPEPNCTDGDEAVDVGKNSDLEDLFQTATEGSLLASSEEQQPPVAADDAVDLGKDSDLGFSEQSEKLGLSKNLDSESEEDDWEEGEDDWEKFAF